MHIPREDNNYREAGEEVWKHDLSWLRNTLKNEGLLKMPEHGIWQITEAGEKDVQLWAMRIKEMVECRPNWAEGFKAHSDPESEFDDEFHYEFYITEEAVRWGIFSDCRNSYQI